MTIRPGHTDPMQAFSRYHWRLSAVVGALLLAVTLAFGDAPERLLALCAFGAVLAGYAAARLWSRFWSIPVSIGLYWVIGLVYYHQLQSSLIDPAYLGQTYGVFSGLFTFGLAQFLGLPGALLGVALSFLAMPDPSVGKYLIHAVFLPIFAALGLFVRKVLYQLHRARQQFELAALTDPLTGLANQRALELEFARYGAMAERSGASLTLSLWDLDGLKAVNDRLGHARGDLYLRQFAQALRQGVREEDALFRIGGDEFVGLHLRLQSPQELERRLRERAAAFSVGFGECFGSLDEALRQADQNMYRQKSARRGDPGRPQPPNKPS